VETPSRSLSLELLVAAALAAALAGCQPRAPAELPPVPAAVARAPALAYSLPVPTDELSNPEVSQQALAEAAPKSVLGDALAAEGLSQESIPADFNRSLLDLQSGETLELLADIPIARTDFGVRMAFSPSSDVLLHNGGGLLIQRFDLVQNQALPALTGIEVYSPFTISVSPDGSAIVADDGNQMHIWSSGSGEQLNSLVLPPVGARVSAGFYADEYFFAADTSGNVLVWDPHSWGEIGRFSYPGRIDTGILFPDGEKIALQDRTRSEIAILDLEGTRLGSLPINGDSDLLLSISPNGDRFLLHVDYGYPTEGIRIVDLASGEALLDLPLLNFRQFAVSSDWSLLAAVGVQNELHLYRLPEGQLLLAQPLGVARTLGINMSGDMANLAFYVFKGGNAGAAIQVWGRATSSH
jgi:WD40 repeat protein